MPVPKLELEEEELLELEEELELELDEELELELLELDEELDELDEELDDELDEEELDEELDSLDSELSSTLFQRAMNLRSPDPVLTTAYPLNSYSPEDLSRPIRLDEHSVPAEPSYTF